MSRRAPLKPQTIIQILSIFTSYTYCSLAPSNIFGNTLEKSWKNLRKLLNKSRFSIGMCYVLCLGVAMRKSRKIDKNCTNASPACVTFDNLSNLISSPIALVLSAPTATLNLFTNHASMLPKKKLHFNYYLWIITKLNYKHKVILF